jgi:hypothetical protein
MGQFQFNTLQANRALNGDFSAADSTITGIGLGIYVGVSGDVTIQLYNPVPGGGEVEVTYTAVPQGTFMQVPLFKQVMGTGGGKTTATDLTISYMAPPYA